MKKSNWLIIVIALAVSAFLLWLWYALRFNFVDAPLDLVLSIIWWILVAVAIFAITRVEKKRQERIRTSYIASNFLFNSEKGFVGLDGETDVMAELEGLLGELEYNFTKNDIKDEDRDRITCIVRSEVFEAAEDEDDEPKWEGEVSFVERKEEDPLRFESRDELAAILAVA